MDWDSQECILAVRGVVVFGWRSGGLGSKVGGGEIREDDMAGSAEVGMCKALERMTGRPLWQEQRSSLESCEERGTRPDGRAAQASRKNGWLALDPVSHLLENCSTAPNTFQR